MNATIPGLATRNWALVEQAKLREVADFYRERGPEGCLEVSEKLYEHGRALGLCDESSRVEDLRHHIELRSKLDRAGRRADERR